MARFRLQQYSAPDYASVLPERDPNNAILPRIGLLLEAMNKMPWFKKKEEEEPETLEEQALRQEYDDYSRYKSLQDVDEDVIAAKKATEQMKGYKPSEDEEPDEHESPVYENSYLELTPEDAKALLRSRYHME